MLVACRLAALCATVLSVAHGAGLSQVGSSGEARKNSEIERAKGVGEKASPKAGARVRRVVIALSSALRKDRSSPGLDHVREVLQMPIEHLGAIVRPVDARAERPPAIAWSEVRAVLTTFRAGDKLAPWVWPWLERVRREQRVRFVHFGHFASLAEDEGRLDAWLRGFGCEYDSAQVDDPVQIEVLRGSDQVLDFEGRQERQRTHGGPRSIDPANKVWVRTRLRKPRPRDRGERTPIVSGAWGGFALTPYAITFGGADYDRRWHIDPFAFFEQALGLRAVPCPDPNVVSGRRAFFFHVDGDGFESISTVRRGEEDRAREDVNCGQVFLEEIVGEYDLPMSLSVIVASLTDTLAPKVATAEMEIARKLFASPKVEVASHAVLHPLNWRRRMTARTPPRTVNWYSGLAAYEHSMVDEVRASIRFIDDWLVPPGKRCRLMFWSGKANPDEAVLRAVRDAACLNLNGGVSRWDVLTNSVGYVRPRGRMVGAEYQVYCGAPNENVYAGFFTTMPGAFWHVDQTLENCGRGRILKPANLYAHFYSAERPARLRTLERLLDKWGYQRDTAPIFASDYVAGVLAARRSCEVRRGPGGTWQLRGFDRCRTLRVEGEERPIDWARSIGILGERWIGSARYFLLAKDEAELVFAERAERAVHVVSANHILRDAERRADGIGLRSQAWSEREVVFGGLPRSGRVLVTVDGDEREMQADAKGQLLLRLPSPGDSRVELRIP